MGQQENSPDRLMPFISGSDFARSIVSSVEQDGYAVLPGVLTPIEAAAEYGRLWEFVTTLSASTRRRDPNLWHHSGCYDPWPCSSQDMVHVYESAWMFNNLRELMAERVFEKLYGTKELHCSNVAFTLQQPTTDESGPSRNDHLDQSRKLRGLHCIQASVALTDQEHDDGGCFMCWPGSHKYHQKLAGRKRGGGPRNDFLLLDDFDKELLVQKGLQPLRVPVRQGDVILWRNDLVHKAAPPVGDCDSFRAVVYLCMLPAALAQEDSYEEKRHAYELLNVDGPGPSQDQWLHKPQPEDRRHFQRPPPLTARQRQLYGLERYPADGSGNP